MGSTFFSGGSERHMFYLWWASFQQQQNLCVACLSWCHSPKRSGAHQALRGVARGAMHSLKTTWPFLVLHHPHPAPRQLFVWKLVVGKKVLAAPPTEKKNLNSDGMMAGLKIPFSQWRFQQKYAQSKEVQKSLRATCIFFHYFALFLFFVFHFWGAFLHPPCGFWNLKKKSLGRLDKKNWNALLLFQGLWAKCKIFLVNIICQHHSREKYKNYRNWPILPIFCQIGRKCKQMQNLPLKCLHSIAPCTFKFQDDAEKCRQKEKSGKLRKNAGNLEKLRTWITPLFYSIQAYSGIYFGWELKTQFKPTFQPELYPNPCS